MLTLRVYNYSSFPHLKILYWSTLYTGAKSSRLLAVSGSQVHSSRQAWRQWSVNTQVDGLCEGLQERTEHQPLCEKSLVLLASQLQAQRSSGSQVCSCVIFLYIWKQTLVLNLFSSRHVIRGNRCSSLSHRSQFGGFTWSKVRSQWGEEKLVPPSFSFTALPIDTIFDSNIITLFWLSAMPHLFSHPTCQTEGNKKTHLGNTCVRGGLHH